MLKFLNFSRSVSLSLSFTEMGLQICSFKPCLDNKLNKKSREYYNHKPQPATPDTKRERKKESNARKINKQMHAKHIDQPGPSLLFPV